MPTKPDAFWFPFLGQIAMFPGTSKVDVRQIQHALLNGLFRPKDWSDECSWQQKWQTLALLEDQTPWQTEHRFAVTVLAISATCIMDLDWKSLSDFAKTLGDACVGSRLAQLSLGLCREWELALALSHLTMPASFHGMTNEPSSSPMRDFIRSLPNELSAFYQISQCGVLMGHGRYSEARTQLRDLAQPTLPLYYQLRASIIAGISAQAQGDYIEAENCLKRQARLVSGVDSDPLNAMLIRRQISFALETENYSHALTLSHKVTVPRLDASISGQTRILLLQEEIKLNLSLGDIAAAKRAMSLLVTALEKSQPDENVIIPLQESCEMALLVNNDTAAALASIEPMFAKSVVNGYYNGQVVCAIYLARIHTLSRQFDAALTTLEVASLVAEKYAFGRDHLRLLLLRILCHAALHQQHEAEAILTELLHKAEALALPSTLLLANFVRLIVTPEKRDDITHKSLLRTFQNQQLTAAVFQYETLVRPLLGNIGREVKKLGLIHLIIMGEKGQKITMPDLLKMANKQRLHVIFPGEKALLHPTRTGLTITRLTLSSSCFMLLVHLCRQGGGPVSPEDIHEFLRPGTPYHPLKHGPRVRSLTQSLRMALAGCPEIGAQLASRKHEADTHYVLEGRLALASTRSRPLLRRRPSGSSANSDGVQTRKERIIEILTLSGQRSGAQLARHFGVTRQALHRDLKALCQMGKIECIGLGRYATYRTRANRLTPAN